MKNTFIVILAIIVLGGGLLLYQNSQSSTSTSNPTPLEVVTITLSATPTPSPEQTENSVITYTDEGFSPNSITVKAGTAVTWINSGNQPMWVASSPHPQHTDLPGFDALKGYASGEEYSYTFTKVGTWKFHDHLDATKFGRVEVTP